MSNHADSFSSSFSKLVILSGQILIICFKLLDIVFKFSYSA